MARLHYPIVQQEMLVPGRPGEKLTDR